MEYIFDFYIHKPVAVDEITQKVRVCQPYRIIQLEDYDFIFLET